MHPSLSTAPVRELPADVLILPLPSGDGFGAVAGEIDAALGGQLTRLRESGDLCRKPGRTLTLYPGPELAADRLITVGLGRIDELDARVWSEAVRTAVREVTGKPGRGAALVLPAEVLGRLGESAARTATTAALVAGQGPGLYQKEPKRSPLAGLTLAVPEVTGPLRTAAERGAAVGRAVNLTRELVDRPAEDVYPESVAARAREVSGEFGLTCTVLDEDAIRAERMGALLAVARGGGRPPRVVKLEHRGGGDGPVLALVGKGVTFDSGGLSIKPNDGMKDMKADMAGAAAVLGALRAIAELKLPVNVTGYLGLTENMISGRSYKLGDVLATRQGTTVEVLNTDAEGRLVLADVLDFARTDGAATVVDLATLTGACVVALGEQITGLFTEHPDLADRVRTAAEAAGELVWPMPMHGHFAKLLKSDVADCKNVGPRSGGAVTAAKFLQKFTGGVPWVHLDIAGPSFADSAAADHDSGATGAMVPTLVHLAEGWGRDPAGTR